MLSSFRSLGSSAYALCANVSLAVFVARGRRKNTTISILRNSGEEH